MKSFGLDRFGVCPLKPYFSIWGKKLAAVNRVCGRSGRGKSGFYCTYFRLQGMMRVSPAAVSEKTNGSGRTSIIRAVSSLQPRPE